MVPLHNDILGRPTVDRSPSRSSRSHIDSKPLLSAGACSEKQSTKVLGRSSLANLLNQYAKAAFNISNRRGVARAALIFSFAKNNPQPGLQPKADLIRIVHLQGMREPHFIFLQNGFQDRQFRVVREQRPPIRKTILALKLGPQRTKKVTEFVVGHLTSEH